jgi:hypothetical protein
VPPDTTAAIFWLKTIISANSIEPYSVAFGFDLFGRRRATEALGKPRDGLFGIFHDEPRLVACYGRILVMRGM